MHLSPTSKLGYLSFKYQFQLHNPHTINPLASAMARRIVNIPTAVEIEWESVFYNPSIPIYTR